jgi:hypothetical protein
MTLSPKATIWIGSAAAPPGELVDMASAATSVSR